MLKSEIVVIVCKVLGDPTTMAELYLLSAVALLSCIVAMRVSSGAFGFAMDTWTRTIAVVGVTLALSLVAVAALRIYAVPSIANPTAQVATQVAAPVLIILVVAIPMQVLLMKGNLVKSVMSIAASLFLAFVLTLTVRAAWHAVLSGAKTMGKSATHKQEIDAVSQ